MQLKVKKEKHDSYVKQEMESYKILKTTKGRKRMEQHNKNEE